MSRRLVVLLLLSVPLLAAPRRPLIPLDFRPAVYVQSAPDVATDGTDFIAVWADERSKDRPNLTRGYGVYASRLTADGQALDPFGIDITPHGSDPQIEWGGSSYLVAFNVNADAYALRLGRDGRPQTAPRVFSNRGVLDLASDGTTFCAIVGNYPDSAAVLLDAEGTNLRRLPIEGLAGSVVSIGRSYMIFTVSGTRLLATTIGRDGSLTQKVLASVAQGSVVRAKSNGSRAVVASTDGTSTLILTVDDRAVAVAPFLSYRTLEGVPAVDAPSVVWDGSTFLVMWPESFGSMTAVRVGSNGRAIGVAPFVLSTSATQMRSASNGFRTVLVSAEALSEALDPVSRVVSSFDTTLPEPHVIAFSGTPYSEPAVAASGKTVMAVAREGEAYGGIAAAIFTPGVATEKRVELAPQELWVTRDGPSVAAAPDAFLVAWREATDWRTRILAKRVLPDGALLDPEPIVVFDEGRAIEHYGETAVAFDGSGFLVVWHSNADEIRARRVGRNGVLGNVTTVSSANGNRDRRTPAVVWSGGSYLVVWSETEPLVGSVSPENPQHTVYRAAKLTRDAVLLGEAETLFTAIGYCQGLTLATGRDRILLTTTTGSYIAGADWPVHVLLLDDAGNPLASAPARIDTATPTFRRMHPAAAWNGASFLVFWNERPWLEDWSVVEGRDVSWGGEVRPLQLDRALSFFPAATPIPGGAVLVETAALEEQAHVARLYARTFEPSSSRKRAARH
jgi:hypothetical protein